MLLEHLGELFPRHIQIHYGQYHREQLSEAARRAGRVPTWRTMIMAAGTPVRFSCRDVRL